MKSNINAAFHKALEKEKEEALNSKILFEMNLEYFSML